MSLFARLKNFIALRFPAAYEIFYNLRHKVRIEDLGAAVYIRSDDFTDYVHVAKKFWIERVAEKYIEVYEDKFS